MSGTVREAMTYLRDGRPADALPLLRRAHEKEPGRPHLQQALATALLRTGDPAGALEAFDQVLKILPCHTPSLHGRALALHGVGDRPGALATFRDLVALAPGSWKAWQSIADITDNESERLDAINQAASILVRLCANPQAPPPLFEQCTAALIHAHDFDTARNLLERETSRFSSPADALNRLADVHYQSGNFHEAFQLKTKVLQQSPPGGTPPGEPAGNFDPLAATAALRELSSLLRNLGINAFPMAGTLLGLVREGAPLASDRDVDVGILGTARDLPDLAGLIRSHPQLLLRRDARPGGRYYAVFWGGIAVDLFLFETSGNDHLVYGVSDRPGDIQWKHARFGLSEASFPAGTWLVPDNPERYLGETYGPDWRHPDPGFASAISSPALFAVDPYARAYYAVARARKALLAGNRTKATALLSQSPIPVEILWP